ncbi:MAG TPA: glycosyltransferase family 4 protein [Candidatus Paceibacterota bacterium]|jgi:glycosyltransferase involved in cell wall biosynthesis|nr:glycosyltransferase family 4 protein [Candidatus Paceibacterota bacterium]
MRIAQIAPIIERVPPKKYGGTERVVSALTEELVRRGHEVTLFASGDSLTTATLQSVYPRNLREARLKDIYGMNIWSLMNIGTSYGRNEEFDIIHDHTGHLSLATANMSRRPVVMTEHGPFTPEVKKAYQTLRKPYIVTISRAQSAPAPDLHYAGNVHNGLPMKHYPFSEVHEGYLLFVGRIAMQKGVHFAIETAQELNLPLIIAAKLDTIDRPYFQQYVEPFLSEGIRWIGEVNEDERNALMSKALCFLHPCTWAEPFGLTLIEAMACGCPVVAFNRGSIPEIVQNRRTGFVVHTIDEMITAVENIGTIDRRRCRRHALVSFGAERMADGYEEIYRKILNKEIS